MSLINVWQCVCARVHFWKVNTICCAIKVPSQVGACAWASRHWQRRNVKVPEQRHELDHDIAFFKTVAKKKKMIGLSILIIYFSMFPHLHGFAVSWKLKMLKLLQSIGLLKKRRKKKTKSEVWSTDWVTSTERKSRVAVEITFNFNINV